MTPSPLFRESDICINISTLNVLNEICPGRMCWSGIPSLKEGDDRG